MASVQESAEAETGPPGREPPVKASEVSRTVADRRIVPRYALARPAPDRARLVPERHGSSHVRCRGPFRR